MRQKLTARFEAQLAEHWPCDETQWLARLAASDLIGLDWPGSKATRSELLTVAELAAGHRCPPPPESLTTIAPVVIDFCPEDRRGTFLSMIREDPMDPSLSLSLGNDTLEVRAGNQSFVAGQPGEGPLLLAGSYSVFCMLQEILLGVTHLRSLRQYWGESDDAGLSHLEVSADTAAALFLRDTASTDLQLALLSGQIREEIAWMLQGYLGYYALLAPDPLNHSNEPVPFPRERAFLQSIQRTIHRDDHLQRDLIWREISPGGTQA